VIDYNDLVSNKDISEDIEKAFGAHEHCLGLLLVKNLPSDYLIKRERLLRLASVFAALPEELKEKTVHADSRYSFGWSCGKEIMNGKPGKRRKNQLLIVKERVPFLLGPAGWGL
jgi:hypothetical protein